MSRRIQRLPGSSSLNAVAGKLDAARTVAPHLGSKLFGVLEALVFGSRMK
jgi:hypothetical protein